MFHRADSIPDKESDPASSRRMLSGKARLWLALLVVAVATVSLAPKRLLAATLPADFVMEPLVQGLNLPTAFVSTPNGRILIAEKAGIVRVFDGTRLLSAPFINLSGEVDSRGDMGLLGLTLDPAYESNGYVYLLFTHTSGYSRLVRVTSDPADKDVAQTGSQLVLLGACPDPTRDQDCMRTNSGIHAIGTVLFGADGSLFVGNGDNSFANVDHPTALRAQDLDSLQGKILRINPQTGEGYPDNPFYNGDPRSNRSKVWAYGLRNPFRFTRDPGTGRIVIGDVGWNGWEEINVGRGANFGWPCYEGGDSSSVRQRDYESYDGCRALYSQGINAVTAPLFGGKHFTWRSITMGDFYSGTAFPEPYRDALFFADYGTNRIYYAHVTLDGLAPQISTVTQFASGVSGTVQLSMGPNGTLYQLNIADGRLERIRYTGVQAPIVVASASPEVEPALPALITFSSAGSAGRNGLPLSYTWDFGDGTPPVETADTTVAHTYSVAGVYDVLLAASDGTASNSTQVRVVVGNEPPTAQIAAPSAGLAFRIGDIISFSGSGSDAEDGVLTGDALTWRVDILHDDHVHYNEYTTTGSAGSFVAADHEDRMGYEICLTARDSVDLTATDCVRIAPEEVIYTVDTVPSGLQIAFSGVSRTTPFQVTTAINGVRSLSAPLMQNGYLFQSWSDGSQADHNITILDAPQTLTATYLEVPTGNNLLQNGSFDQGLQFWQREPTHTWVQAKQSAGNNYIATWPWNQYLFFQNSITVEAGVTHVACADFFTDTTNSYVVKIRLTENGTPVGLDQVLERGYNCYAFSPTRSTSNARFELYFDGLRTSGTQLNFDNLSLVGGSGSAAPATPTATATATPTSAAGPQPTATPTATSVPNSGPSATPTAATASASELVQNGEFDAGLQDWLRDPGHNWVQIAASNGDAYVNTWPWNGYTFLQEGLEIERGRQYRACVDFFTTTTYSYAVWLRLMDGSNRAGLEQQLTPGEHCFDFAATLSSANARLELTFSNLRTGGTKLSFDALSLAPISGTTAPNPTATHTATATGTPTTSAPPTATATSATEASLTPTATAPPAASETPTATPEPPTATITATNTPSPPATGEDTELLQNGDFSAGLQDWQRDPGHSWVQLGNGGGNPFIKTWPWNGYTFFQRGLTLEEGRAYRACVDFSTSTANPYAVQLRMMDGTTPLGLDESLTPGRNCFQFTATGSSTTGRFELAFSALRVGGTRLDFASASLVRLGTSAVPTPTATQTPTISPATATSTPNAGPSATPTVTALPSATPSPTPASTSEELLQNGSFESLLQGWGRSPEHNWIQVRQRNGGDRYAIMWPWNGYEFFQGAIPVEQGASYRACVTFFTDTTYSYAVRLQLTDGASNLGLDEPLVRGDQCFTFTASGSATAGRLLLYFSNLRVGGTSLSFDNLSLKRLQPSG